MRIGEVARAVGVSADTVRFYERSGLLPAPRRRENDYREYDAEDVEHLRLLIGLRRLDLPLDDAARLARWCHSGHCDATTGQLPSIVTARRAEVAARIASLVELDRRLAILEGHLERHGGADRGTGRGADRGTGRGADRGAMGRRDLVVVGADGACCDAAGVALAGDAGCACCSPAPA